MASSTKHGICKHCSADGRIYHRGLCKECYADRSLRARYPKAIDCFVAPAGYASIGNRGTCQNCRRENAVMCGRGLCTRCHSNLEIRYRFQSAHPLGRRGARTDANITLPLDANPTPFLPGSPEKEAVMSQRAAAGHCVNHPLDAKLPDTRTAVLTEDLEPDIPREIIPSDELLNDGIPILVWVRKCLAKRPKPTRQGLLFGGSVLARRVKRVRGEKPRHRVDSGMDLWEWAEKVAAVNAVIETLEWKPELPLQA